MRRSLWEVVCCFGVWAVAVAFVVAIYVSADGPPAAPLPVAPSVFASAGSSPTVSFVGPDDLASYTLSLHHRVTSLELALERDIHSGADLPCTHEVLDGIDLDGDGVVGE